MDKQTILAKHAESVFRTLSESKLIKDSKIKFGCDLKNNTMRFEMPADCPVKDILCCVKSINYSTSEEIYYCELRCFDKDRTIITNPHILGWEYIRLHHGMSGVLMLFDVDNKSNIVNMTNEIVRISQIVANEKFTKWPDTSHLLDDDIIIYELFYQKCLTKLELFNKYLRESKEIAEMNIAIAEPKSSIAFDIILPEKCPIGRIGCAISNECKYNKSKFRYDFDKACITLLCCHRNTNYAMPGEVVGWNTQHARFGFNDEDQVTREIIRIASLTKDSANMEILGKSLKSFERPHVQDSRTETNLDFEQDAHDQDIDILCD